MNNPDHEAYELIYTHSNSESFLHFYSNWIVNAVSFDSVTNQINLGLFETQDSLDFELHPGVGLYQINRLAISLLSCYLEEGLSFLDLVKINITNYSIPNVTQPVNDLVSFSKRPLYGSDGEINVNGTKARVCGAKCEITPYLTNSPEPCLAPMNTVNSSCDYVTFGNVPPFVDLNFENPPTHENSKSSKFRWYYAGIPAIIVFVILVIVLVVLIYKRKKRLDYNSI